MRYYPAGDSEHIAINQTKRRHFFFNKKDFWLKEISFPNIKGWIFAEIAGKKKICSIMLRSENKRENNPNVLY